MVETKVTCPKETLCIPFLCISSENNKTFVCVGKHNEQNSINEDIFRHCFRSETTDSCYDYSEYDLMSVVTTMNYALLHQRYLEVE